MRGPVREHYDVNYDVKMPHDVRYITPLVFVILLVSIWTSSESGHGMETDECQSSTCQNGGTCIDGVGKYTCQCPQRNADVTEGTTTRTFLTGFSGMHCENDIDECKVQPSICLNGADCKNTMGSYVCKCGGDATTFYTGTNCEKSATYCDIHPELVDDPPACKNNGTCQALPMAYRCDCAPGFTGGRCRTNIDECASNPCHYSSTCVDGIGGYECVCIPGRSGINCAIDTDECASNPCLNGGVCTDYCNRFECNCTDTGFTGMMCDINIDDCASNACAYNSSCVDGINGYTCACIPGRTGVHCDIDIDYCDSEPCLNGGLCIDHIDRFVCNCTGTGFTGVTCDVNTDGCEYPPCINGAMFNMTFLADFVFVLFIYFIFRK